MNNEMMISVATIANKDFCVKQKFIADYECQLWEVDIIETN